MGSSRISKYAYVLDQVRVAGSAYFDMFGRETLLTNNQLEEMRQRFNADGGHVKSVSLVAQTGRKKGQVVASSKQADGGQAVWS